MIVIEARSFIVAEARLRAAMLERGQPVKTETWQGSDALAGALDTRELLNVTLGVTLGPVQESATTLRLDARPNLPWADDHFLERVSGEPLNPPPSWAWWPGSRSAASFRKDEQFNHTYPERFWPKFAGLREDMSVEAHKGIRGAYGDLDDVMRLLIAQPHTRQAYLPVWFPEDTGVGDGGRKPCTLGYHFIIRGSHLHCVYFMRSCDLMRHFRDDAYLAVLLMKWVCARMLMHTKLGTLTMHMTSLHCFANDMGILRAERDAAIAGGLA